MDRIVIASEHGLVIQDKNQVTDAIGLCFGADGLLLTEHDLGQEFFRLEIRRQHQRKGT